MTDQPTTLPTDSPQKLFIPPRRTRRKKFTDRQEKFIKYYAGNAADAARKSGYSKKTARSVAQDLLTNPYIQEALRKRNEKKDNKEIASREERQAFWTAMMIRRKKTKDCDRLKASELLGRSEADFAERLIHEGFENLALRLETARKRITQ